MSRFRPAPQVGNLVAQYVYNGNKVILVTALDPATGIITSPAHGLTQTHLVMPVLQPGVSFSQAFGVIPIELTLWKYVHVLSPDTLQLSTTKATLTPLVINPTGLIDVSKWRLEAVVSEVTNITVSKLPPRRRYVARATYTSNVGAMGVITRLFPIVPNFEVSKWIRESAPDLGDVGLGTFSLNTVGQPDIKGFTTAVFSIGDEQASIEYDAIHLARNTAGDKIIVRARKDRYYTRESSIVGKDITSIQLGLSGYMLGNGSSLEVYEV